MTSAMRRRCPHRQLHQTPRVRIGTLPRDPHYVALAERLVVGIASLDQSIGEDQQPVSWLKEQLALLISPRRELPEDCSRSIEFHRRAIRAHQERRIVSRIAIREPVLR